MADDRMDGKVCVVTGANSGIGKATAVALSRLGAATVLVCRNRARGEAAIDEVRAAAPAAPPPRLEVADLSSTAQVRDLAARLSEVDVLVNNAGLILGEHRTTADGFEYTFAVNHLAPFLLTNLLLDRIQGRIVVVTSGVHSSGRIDFDNLHGHTGMRAYADSKLANILFTYELARRLNGTGITANCAHPGGVRTGFGREGSPLMRWGYRTIALPFLRSPKQGAKTIVYLASSPEVADTTGEYFVRRRPRRSSAASYDEVVARRLWEVSEEMTELRGGARRGEAGE
ncbi:MAG TPA: SDR family oxidoreductase [Streptosporangiaceae bacterium]|jgi:NAD(P)-dependent dehydrogenase (short-subunit alcohol dehydrogenase family)